MKRIILMVLHYLYIVPFWYLKLCLLSRSDKYDDMTQYSFIRKIAIKANKAGHVTIDCHGIENLPTENGYVIFPNHQGLFDVLSFLETDEQPFRVVMKKETQKVHILRVLCTLLHGQVIDREDIRQSMHVIMNMTNEVKEGKNYIIFAEGTRSRKGNEINEFKGGSFKSAMNARCPIVPVALIDSFKAFDTHSIKPLTVQIHYLEPICYEEYKGMKSVEIAKMVEDRIKATIAAYTKDSLTDTLI